MSPVAGAVLGHGTTRGSGQVRGAFAGAAPHVGYAKGAHLPFTHDESVSHVELGLLVPVVAPSEQAPPSAITIGQVPASEKDGGPPS